MFISRLPWKISRFKICSHWALWKTVFYCFIAGVKFHLNFEHYYVRVCTCLLVCEFRNKFMKFVFQNLWILLKCFHLIYDWKFRLYSIVGFHSKKKEKYTYTHIQPLTTSCSKWLNVKVAQIEILFSNNFHIFIYFSIFQCSEEFFHKKILFIFSFSFFLPHSFMYFWVVYLPSSIVWLHQRLYLVKFNSIHTLIGLLCAIQPN